VATVPSPKTWTALEDVTAAEMNLEVRDAINFLLSPPRVWAYRTALLTLTTATLTVVPMTAEVLDTDGMHSTVTNTSRVTAVTAGQYMVLAGAQFAANATGYRHLQLRKNANGVAAGGTQLFESLVPAAPTGSHPVPPLVAFVDLAATDYVELFARQSSGGNLDINAGGQYDCYLQAYRVGA
jgi:hypothetical protein